MTNTLILPLNIYLFVLLSIISIALLLSGWRPLAVSFGVFFVYLFCGLIFKAPITCILLGIFFANSLLLMLAYWENPPKKLQDVMVPASPPVTFGKFLQNMLLLGLCMGAFCGSFVNKNRQKNLGEELTMNVAPFFFQERPFKVYKHFK